MPKTMKATRCKLLDKVAPRLTDELLDAILVWRIRLIRVVNPQFATKLVRVLGVLPRSVAPLATRAVLVKKPWLQIESLVPLCDMWLIKSFLLLSKPPHNHPIQFKWERVIEEAVARGDVSFLKWWREQQFPVGSVFDPDQVCKNGNVAVLDWAKSAQLDITFTELSIQRVFRHGHKQVLDWIASNHGGGSSLLDQARNNPDTIALAVAAGHDSILHWLLPQPAAPIARHIVKVQSAAPSWNSWLLSTIKSSGPVDLHRSVLQDLLPSSAIKSVFPLACASGNLDTLDACLKHLTFTSAASPASASFLPNRNQRTTHLAYLYASAAGHVSVLNWLDDHDFVPLTVISACSSSSKKAPAPAARLVRARLRDENALEERLLSHFIPNAQDWIHVHSAIDFASIMGHVNVLDWWLDMRDLMEPVDFEYSPLAINTACRMGNANVVEWWIKSGLPLKHSQSSVLAAPAALGHVNVLQAWRGSNVENLIWNPAMLIRAAQNGAVNVLDWWAKEWSVTAVRSAIEGSIMSCRDARVVEWYLDHGGNKSKWNGKDSWGQTPKLEIHLSFKSSPFVSRSLSDQSNASQDEQETKKQVYLAFQRLSVRYPRLPIVPLTAQKVKLLAEGGCAAFIKYCSSQRLMPDEIDLDDLCQSDNCVPVMHWLVFSQNMIGFKYSSAALVKATKAGATAVLAWWMCSSPPLAFKTSLELENVIKSNDMDGRTAEWWKRHASRLLPMDESLWARPKPMADAKKLMQRKKLRPRALNRFKGSSVAESGTSSVDNLVPLMASLAITNPAGLALAT